MNQTGAAWRSRSWRWRWRWSWNPLRWVGPNCGAGDPLARPGLQRHDARRRAGRVLHPSREVAHCVVGASKGGPSRGWHRAYSGRSTSSVGKRTQPRLRSSTHRPPLARSACWRMLNFLKRRSAAPSGASAMAGPLCRVHGWPPAPASLPPPQAPQWLEHEGRPYYIYSASFQATSATDVAVRARPEPARPAATPSSALRMVGNVCYTCRMHPQVRQSDPGACPACGMALAHRECSPH